MAAGVSVFVSRVRNTAHVLSCELRVCALGCFWGLLVHTGMVSSEMWSGEYEWRRKCKAIPIATVVQFPSVRTSLSRIERDVL